MKRDTVIKMASFHRLAALKQKDGCIPVMAINLS